MRKTLLLSCLGLLFLGFVPLANAESKNLPQLPPGHTYDYHKGHHLPSTERVVPYVYEYNKKHLNHLYSFEKEPLGDQIPLVIVPGRAQESQSNPWWEKLQQYLDEYPDVRDKYKVYIFLYDSTQHVDHTGLEFKHDFVYFVENLPKNHKDIVIISYSLGGQIVRDSLIERPDLMSHVDTVFGLSVAYHGSPLFDPEWMKDTFSHYSPIHRGWDKFFYGMYLLPKQNLVDDMGFDNFDQSKPDAIIPNKVLGLIKKEPKSLRPLRPVWDESTSAALREFKSKLVVYGAYIQSDLTAEPPTEFLHTLSQLNEKTIGAVWPNYFPSVHRTLEFMGREMGKVQVANVPENALHPYRYNDGVIPTSSLFYLPNRDTPYTEDIAIYPTLWDICGGRLFEDIDHVDIGHYRWPPYRMEARDIFDPEKEKRKPLDWLFQDLKHLNTPRGFSCS